MPNYFASMPSWYNLFFATFGIAALLRHADSGRARWLVAAGVAGGCSFLAKISGVYFIAAAFVFLVIAESLEHEGPAADRRTDLAIWLKAALALLMCGSVGWLVRSHRGLVPLVHFVVPIAAIALLLM